ncbi:MAG: hypothetical protein K5905_14590, partial [Roseibium sp.]|uniref:hypothetical protein n=1 Tax=Roseibium sp. TaxID=1936156 RepID=UPI002621BDF8
YGDLLEKLANSRQRLVVHRSILISTQKEVEEFVAGHRSGLFSHLRYHFKNELIKMDDALRRAEIRLAIPVEMSKQKALKKAN